jgi:hypothetical protein
VGRHSTTPYVEQHKVGVDAFEEDMRKRFPAEVQSAQDRLIAELATLDPISYAQRKKTVAKELGIPGRANRPSGQGAQARGQTFARQSRTAPAHAVVGSGNGSRCAR